MRFNISDYQDGKYVMHCSTKEESDLFREYMHDAGMRWCSGITYLDKDNWSIYGKDFCYNFNKGSYADDQYYVNAGYIILDFDCFEFVDEPEIQVSQLQLKYDDLL